MPDARHLIALETSARQASVALLTTAAGSDPPLVRHRQVPPAERTASALVPALRDLLREAGVEPETVDAVAVASGPGSFTGLRIGVTAAKVLAYAAGCKLVGVNTLDVLARQAADVAGGRRVWAALDAQRGDLFCCHYSAGDWRRLGHADRTEVMTAERWLERLRSGDLIVGPVVGRYADQLPKGVDVAPAATCQPSANTVAQLGWHLLGQRVVTDPFHLVPRYHRLSAAEEKARAAGG